MAIDWGIRMDALDVSLSGLLAQRTRLDTVANNIANISTTSDASGQGPFLRRRVIFQSGQQTGEELGVHVAAIEQERPGEFGAEPFRLELDPGHPHADKDGYVRYPNIDLTKETVNAMEAARAYEANLQAIETTRYLGQQVNRLIE